MALCTWARPAPRTRATRAPQLAFKRSRQRPITAVARSSRASGGAVCKSAHMGASIVVELSSKSTFTTGADVGGRRDLQLDKAEQRQSCDAPTWGDTPVIEVTISIRNWHVMSGWHVDARHASRDRWHGAHHPAGPIDAPLLQSRSVPCRSHCTSTVTCQRKRASGENVFSQPPHPLHSPRGAGGPCTGSTEASISRRRSAPMAGGCSFWGVPLGSVESPRSYGFMCP